MSIRTYHDLGNKGTPPRARTLRRMIVQKNTGLPLVGKRIRLGGIMCHPTKGYRPNVND